MFQSTILPFTISPVADELVMGTGGVSAITTEETASIHTKDVSSGQPLTESLLMTKTYPLIPIWKLI